MVTVTETETAAVATAVAATVAVAAAVAVVAKDDGALLEGVIRNKHEYFRRDIQTHHLWRESRSSHRWSGGRDAGRH